MLQRALYENSRPDGIGVLEIVAEQSTAPRQFVPLQRSEVCGDVVGPLATLQVRQIFGFRQQQTSAQSIEALYRFPLPGDAAVTKVTVYFGTVEILATLAARDQAEADYAAAKQEGRQAALAKRETPDVFTLQVAGLQPDQPITVETHYVQVARQESGQWTLRIPLTTAPRYVRSDEQRTRSAQGQPLAVLRDPGHRFRLDLRFHGVHSVTSPTHALAITETAGQTQIQLQAGELLPDRDCVLYWQAAQAAQQPQLTLFAQPSAADAQLYFLAQVAPPRAPQRQPLPREIILLVDHSGSMTGPKWAATDWAVESFLAGLQAADSFALAIFHNETRWFAPALQQATPATTANAIQWLKQSTDSGGTELGVALEGALRLPRTTGEAARHLLILTDAAVTDGDRILRLADQERQRAAHDGRRRLSVICIDAAPNAFLAQELAERGGGVAKFLTSDPAQEDITTALDEVLSAWAEPLYANLRLAIHHPQAEMSDQQTLLTHTAQTTVVDLGDLAGGQPRWLVGRLPYVEGEEVTVEVRLADDTPLTWATLAPTTGGATANLRALFGARRILGLEYLMQAGLPAAHVAEQLTRLGYDAAALLGAQTEQAPPVYAETARTQMTTALRDLLIKEALRYGLASAETAFIATRTEAGQRVQGQVIVANALPAGWSEQFVTGAAAKAQGLRRMAAMPAPTMQLGMARSSPAMNVQAAYAPPTRGLPSSPAKGDDRGTGGQTVVLFCGEVKASPDPILLYSASAPSHLPATMTIRGLALRHLATEPSPDLPDRAVELQLFVGDLASPRARVRLSDLLRQGQRPLNIERTADQPLELRLIDPTGWLQNHRLQIEVTLHW